RVVDSSLRSTYATHISPLSLHDALPIFVGTTDLLELPDQELMQRHRDGDPDAFGELFRRHRDRMWAVALRTTRDPELAADAVQRSEEHTSELQSRFDLVCRLLLEKKNIS